MNIKEMYRNWPRMAREALKLTVTHELESTTLARVVVAGMGGSGIVGDYAYWLARVHGSSIPFETVRDPGPFPPGWLNASLVFLVSYSGNTRETLAFTHYALSEARGDPLSTPTMLVTVTSGGQLEQLARENGVPLIKVPSGLLPRASLPYLLLPLLRVLVEAEAMGSMGMEELKAGTQALEAQGEAYAEKAGELSNRILGWRERRVEPLVVGCGASAPLAVRFRTEMAENAKITTSDVVVPEAGHNMVEALAGEGRRLGIIMVNPDYEPCTSALDAFNNVLREARVVEDVVEWRRGELGFLSWYLLTSMAWGLASVHMGEALGRDPANTPWLKRFRSSLQEKW